MTIKTDVIALAVASLADIRSSGITLALQDLVARPVHGGGIPEHRIYYKGTDTPVETYEELIANITDEHTKLTYSLSSIGASFKDKCKPVKLVLKNLEVRFMDDVEDDSYFTFVYGKKATTIVLTLGYLGDNDPDLPLKVIDLSLYSDSAVVN